MSQHNHPARRVIALDLGDRKTTLVRREDGEIVHEKLVTQREAFTERFADEPPSRVVFEAGSQSPWVAWLLVELGDEPVAVHPRRLLMITRSARKCDRTDGEWLLRLAETDLQILSPVQVRSRHKQTDLVRLRIRENLICMRVQAVLAVRSQAKLFGCALPSGGPVALPKRARETLPADLQLVLQPLLHQIESLTVALRKINAQIERTTKTKYRETAALTQVPNIGALTALTLVLTLQNPDRFTKSREVGPVVGLVPRQRQSGSRDPELRITKQGDGELRRLLVLAAQRFMRNAAPDTDLKRFGLRLAARGGKNAKKRAVVAVARKLAVLLVALWKSGEVYEPLRHAEQTLTPAA